jgi:segregation and condensation protein A
MTETGEEQIDIEQLVASSTWRDILLELVTTEQLDPWNIDISRTADRYIERVKQMKFMDLHVPANVILAASILLRLKADSLPLESEEQVAEQETFIEGPTSVEVPMLQLRLRIPPKRAVTLVDLMHAMEEVMEIERRHARAATERKEVMEIKLPAFNIEKETAKMLERVKKLADTEGMLTFSDLVKNMRQEQKNTPSKQLVVYTLIPLLYLTQDRKVIVMQDEHFGEIFIELEKKANAEESDKDGRRNKRS